MTKQLLPSFKDLSKALDKTSLKMHASQVHGLLAGLLCGQTNEANWEELVTGEKTNQTTHQLLQSLFDISARQLKEDLYDFQPVLPTDKASLPERAEALTLWCQGVLTGLKMAKIQMVGREPGDVTEAIEDLIEIAKMNYEEVVASEEDEAAYMELVEYVRMAVILIYQAMHETSESANPANLSSHLH